MVSFYYYNLYDPANECAHALHVCSVLAKVKHKFQVILKLHLGHTDFPKEYRYTALPHY